ncbi:Diadenosine tetraphosphate (Ap4A) hydrolase [Marinactinospora thermotolerans DSM 45154]|uniref:Diadenosine tetraphosphate (Ap4A) hydrolase n=1 Tax=Marinactinospora thermotolerans DSM 45154 TaxID=1122192 RepID=A0A1T4TDG8_9ACTN|nr:HIT family protein [Marinactinospora thermotolerans]SKA38457.1 Diadenosine tetraphosphate (Ap4A) hydrolase [Marinactinospora thermotolerans DSM 45154]
MTEKTEGVDCVFCRIVSGDAPCHPIWEDERHLAFLSIFPNTEGFSVVVTKEHLSSYVVDLGDDSYLALHLAAREAARRLDAAFPDVARTGIIYEGYGVDHAHAKLFPMHGTSGNSGADWRAVESDVDLYFERYQGYLSSHDHGRADDDELARLARRIRTSL